LQESWAETVGRAALYCLAGGVEEVAWCIHCEVQSKAAAAAAAAAAKHVRNSVVEALQWRCPVSCCAQQMYTAMLDASSRAEACEWMPALPHDIKGWTQFLHIQIACFA
jgi:hypothetical protein